MTDDIRFHERLLRLSEWIDGDPNIDEDLWPLPKQALDEIKRLRAENKRLDGLLIRQNAVMADDIVTRLREHSSPMCGACDTWGCGKSCECSCHLNICQEAADEIERLRALATRWPRR